MLVKSIEGFDFADSEFIELAFYEESLKLVISIKTWDGVLYDLIFENCLGFDYRQSFQIANLYHNHSLTHIEAGAWNCALEEKFSKLNLKEFQLHDIDDFPFIKIIAESVLLAVKDRI